MIKAFHITFIGLASLAFITGFNWTGWYLMLVYVIVNNFMDAI